MSPSRSHLLAAAQALCNDFSCKAPLPTLLSHFSTTHQVSAHEHGLPLLAPFLGRTFTGLSGPNSVETYFTLLHKLLDYEDMRFGEWVVDAEARKVACKGRARFRWVEGAGAGHWWDETFAYVLDFDDEGKVTDYQVWADSGAAYLASKGDLNGLREEFEAQGKTA